MKPDDLIALNEQIAAMARAGLPLDQGLAGLASDMGRGRLRSATEALARDLRDGHPLAEALERLRGQVPAYYSHLVTAGIRTGKLPDVLATLSEYARAISNLRRTVVDALFYPALVLLFGVGIFMLMALVIAPQFDETYREFGMKLPAASEFMLGVTRHPVENFLVPVAGVVLGVFLCWVFFRFTPRGRWAWARSLYLVPLVGSLIRAARLTAFSELLALLVEYEVPLPEAFRMAGAVTSDPLMAAQAHEVHELLEQGVPLGEAFRDRGLVPAWMAWMAGAGEQRNGLAESLRQVAAVYRQQAESRAAVLRSVLPPFFVSSIAAVLVGVFGVAIFLPMIKLLEGLAR